MPTFLERLNSAHGGNLEDTIALCQLIVESEGRVKELRECVPEPLYYDLCLLYVAFSPSSGCNFNPFIFFSCASSEMLSLLKGSSPVEVFKEFFCLYNKQNSGL